MSRQPLGYTSGPYSLGPAERASHFCVNPPDLQRDTSAAATLNQTGSRLNVGGVPLEPFASIQEKKNAV
jgi:hypothetical protein